MKQITKRSELDGSTFLIFKHSNRCPISARAARTVSSVEGELPVPTYTVIVHDARELSNAIAADFGVPHESPQLILIKDGKAVWHASHYEITADSIREAAAKQ